MLATTISGSDWWRVETSVGGSKIQPHTAGNLKNKKTQVFYISGGNNWLQQQLAGGCYISTS